MPEGCNQPLQTLSNHPEKGRVMKFIDEPLLCEDTAAKCKESLLASWGNDLWDEECSTVGDKKQECMGQMWQLRAQQQDARSQDVEAVATGYRIPIKLL